MQIVYKPYFEEASLQAGCTASEIASGRRVAELYAAGELIDAQIIKTTTGRGPFRPWLRLKVARSGVRAIVEIDDDTLVVHAALPRWSNTYDDALALWRQHRTRI